MDIEYIIVQAGGKGTRLEHLTANKPKALVPVGNLPMLFHLFRKYPDKRFIIIGDYHKEVLRKYLRCFADVNYILVEAEGTGTCGGLKAAMSKLPTETPFMLIWSDLVLPASYKIPEERGNYIGISQTFSCRYSFKDNVFKEEASVEHGVAGMFIFEDKAVVSDVPDSGEFVRYLTDKNIDFRETGLAETCEFGLLSVYGQLPQEKCRPFNRITEKDGIITKEGIDEQGKQLAVRERNWYRYASEKAFTAIPKLYGLDPISMEKIDGKNIYEYGMLPYEQKKKILSGIVEKLNELHSLHTCKSDSFSVWEAYLKKTLSRLHKVRDLIPMADEEYIVVNGRKCRNVYRFASELERRMLKYDCDSFSFIHGDCTFSNIMLRSDNTPVFIDPRGYFGNTELFGDKAYDWAKLYYSVRGNYDRFNLKQFRLEITDSIKLDIESNHWEDMENDFFDMIDTPKETLRMLHAIIWLSLTTYAWQDYDSICGAFYNGIYYLEEVL